MKWNLSRRTFLASLAAFSIVPRRCLGGPGFTPPSEELTKAVVGVGGMGRVHVKYPGARLLAVCDVDENHLRGAIELGGADVKGYRDFREVLARDDIDVVHIPTPPHWHALMVVAAAEAGKDIWGEKPMARTIGEGRAMVRAIERHGRIYRINTTGRYEGSQLYTRLRLSGMLGWPWRVMISPSTGYYWKFDQWTGRTDLEPRRVPDALDYDFWLGPAPVKPYHPHRVHQSFRGYWDYDGGGLGDLGQHIMDPVQCFLGKDDTGPVEIEVETAQQHPDAVLPWRRIVYRYADGCEIVLEGDSVPKREDEPFITTPAAKLWKGGRSTIPNLREELARFPDPEPVETDFYACVRSRRKFALNEANGHRSCSLINLGKIAVRLGRNLRFDPIAETFPDDPQANALIHQPMRAPWRLPEI